MNCKEFVDFLMAYINDELPRIQRDEFERHIRDCPPCITFLDTYRETLELEKHAYEDADDSLLQQAPEPLVEAILAARRKGDSES